MVKCEYCGKEIGLLEVRYTWLDKENKIAIHDRCIEEYEKKKSEKTLKPQEKLVEQEKQLLKEIRKEMDEKIIGKIHGLNLPGLTDQIYNLVFTDKRMIGEFIGGSGAGFLVGGLIGNALTISHYKKKSEEMQEVNPEEILSRNKKNFSIDYMYIDEIKLDKKKMKIVFNQKHPIVGKKAVFYFSKEQFNDFNSVLMKALPNKIVV